MPIKEYLEVKIMKITPFGWDPNSGVIADQLIGVKTENDLELTIFDPMLHFMKSVTRNMVGQSKKMIVFSSAENIEKTNDNSPRIIRVINKEPGRPSDRLLMIAQIKKIFKKGDADYGNIIIDAGFGNIWLGVPEGKLGIFNINDLIKVETSHLELNNILN